MKPFVIGLVLAAVVLAAGLLAPTLLPPATDPNTLKALEDAELARRQLHAHEPRLPLIAARSDIAQLKDADLDKLAEQSREAFAETYRQLNERVDQAKRRDRDSGMPEGDLQPLAWTGSGVKSAVSTLERFLRENRQLLTNALQASQSASRADREALGVGQVAGAVRLVEAAGLLVESRRLRSQLATVQARALAVASEWAAVRTARDHHAGLDVTRIQGDLNADLEEIDTALGQAQTEVGDLARAVAEREQTLAQTRADLEQVRTERLSVEEMGFSVGNDASFEAYREKYLQLAQRLRELQDREQLLAFGGIRGGTVTDDDLLEGEIEGGETVVGLDELQRRLAIATDKLERYTKGRKALEDQLSFVGTVGAEAQTQKGRCAARLETLTAGLDGIRQRMAELAQRAFDKEQTALRAAREAANAFKSEKTAVDRWIGAARSLQQQKDPQRTNERLRRIVADNFAADFAANAEAQAKTVVGRIHAERALGLAAYLDTLARVGEFAGIEFDTAALQDNFNTARDEAVGVLIEARDGYERLAQKQTDTSWVHRASLAVVYHLLWQIDEFNAEQHRSNLIDQLGKVLANRSQWPYLQQQVELYDYLTGGEVPQPAGEEAGDEPDDEEPATDEEDE